MVLMRLLEALTGPEKHLNSLLKAAGRSLRSLSGPSKMGGVSVQKMLKENKRILTCPAKALNY